MFDEESPLELLMPSADLADAIERCLALEAELGKLGRTPVNAPWAQFPWHACAKALARFSLYTKGFNPDAPLPEYEVLHTLSTELGIMSPTDFREQFLHITEGNPITRLYRKLTNAANVRKLLTDENTFGWSGFQPSASDREAARAMTRRRMVVDAFRESDDWSRLRALELSDAAALLMLAIEAGVLTVAAAERYEARCVTEAAVRFENWGSFAAALLRARLFVLAQEEGAELTLTLERDAAFLRASLTEQWQTLSWPEFTDGEPPLSVPTRL